MGTAAGVSTFTGAGAGAGASTTVGTGTGGGAGGFTTSAAESGGVGLAAPRKYKTFVLPPSQVPITRAFEGVGVVFGTASSE